MQLVPPLLLAKLPGVHLSHDVAPVLLLDSPAGHRMHALVSLLARLEFPYVPAGHRMHWLEFALVEYVPCVHPSHRNIPLESFTPPNTTLYPTRHTHLLRMEPAGESEKGGHPVQEPEYGMLYVFGSHGVQLVDLMGAKVPAGHHAHARYDPAASSDENVPFGQA